MLPKRLLIIDALVDVLTTELGANYDVIAYWQDYSTEYGKNYLILRDTVEDHAEINRVYNHTLHCELEAVVFAEDAARAGTLALANLIRVLGTNHTLNGLANAIRITSNSKEIVTAGKKAAQVLFEFDVIYRTEVYTYV